MTHAADQLDAPTLPDLPPKFCIFCGERPNEKTKEHVLPGWLLRLTGDPNRVVPFGVDWSSGKQPRFAYDQFTFPACDGCNGRYSALEDRVQRHIEALLARAPLTSMGYVDVLDWLDKVRIGLWLGYRYLHKNYMQVSPKFTIDTRVGAKDRMVAVYCFDNQSTGLTSFAEDTPLFQLRPSVFGLRINHLLLLNASWDWMCSARCGFPYAESVYVDLDTGLLAAEGLHSTGTIKHPVAWLRHKPVVMLHQPILPVGGSGRVVVELGPEDTYTRQHLLDGARQGFLFRQFLNRTVAIQDPGAPIVFDSVVGRECATMRQIVAEIFLLQGNSTAMEKFKSRDPDRYRAWHANLAAARVMNRRLAKSVLDGTYGHPSAGR